MKTKPNRVREQTKFWQAADIGQVDLLKATYITHTFSRHTHEGYVIGVIEKGAEAFDYRGATHLAPAGSVVVINPDEVHTGYAGHEAGWVYRTLYPAADLLKQVAGELAGKPGRLPYFPDPVIQDPRLAQLVRRLHLTLESSRATLEREIVFSDALAHLIANYADDRPVARSLGREHYAVEKVRAYLEACYADNISVTQLAEAVSLSPFYLTRVFSRAVGFPPHAYLTQVRIARAKDLLSAGLPISQVAAETGFVDQSHLTRHFKRIVGVTPGQYVRKGENVQYR